MPILGYSPNGASSEPDRPNNIPHGSHLREPSAALLSLGDFKIVLNRIKQLWGEKHPGHCINAFPQRPPMKMVTID